MSTAPPTGLPTVSRRWIAAESMAKRRICPGQVGRSAARRCHGLHRLRRASANPHPPRPFDLSLLSTLTMLLSSLIINALILEHRTHCTGTVTDHRRCQRTRRRLLSPSIGQPDPGPPCAWPCGACPAPEREMAGQPGARIKVGLKTRPQRVRAACRWWAAIGGEGGRRHESGACLDTQTGIRP